MVLAVVFNGTNAAFYVNGYPLGVRQAPFQETVGCTPPSRVFNRVSLGRPEGLRPFHAFAGQLATGLVWTRALSATEVQALYQGIVTVPTPVSPPSQVTPTPPAPASAPASNLVQSNSSSGNGTAAEAAAASLTSPSKSSSILAAGGAIGGVCCTVPADADMNCGRSPTSEPLPAGVLLLLTVSGVWWMRRQRLLRRKREGAYRVEEDESGASGTGKRRAPLVAEEAEGGTWSLPPPSKTPWGKKRTGAGHPSRAYSPASLNSPQHDSSPYQSSRYHPSRLQRPQAQEDPEEEEDCRNPYGTLEESQLPPSSRAAATHARRTLNFGNPMFTYSEGT